MFPRIFMFAGIWLLIFSLFIPAVCCIMVSPDSSDIDTARILAKKAVEYEESGMHDLAISSYSSALRSYPRYADAWSGMGSVLSRLGRYKEALIALDQAIALDPRDSVAWYSRGVVLQHLQRYEQARQDIDESLRISPNNSFALARLGEVQLSLGDFEGALRSFHASASVDPSDGSAFAGLGEAFYHLNDYSNAKNATIMALDLYPDNLRAWQVMADIADAEGKTDWAAYYRRTAVDIVVYGLTMPEYAKALALERAFLYTRSLFAYDNAIQKYPNVAIIRVSKGEVLKKLGRYDKALQSYNQAVELDPQNADIRLQRDQMKEMIQ
ncbi:MAG: tetratricopeptide repeat protein [Methanobacteriota archaeon]